MTRILTEEEIQRIMKTWVSWYAMHGVQVDLDSVAIGAQPLGYDFPILNAKEMPPNEVNEAFKRAFDQYGIVCFTAPAYIGVIGGSDPNASKVRTFSDLVGTNDRTAEDGTYVFWVKRHFKVRDDGSFKSKPFDTRMTVEEAMLYHLYWLWHYSYRYVGHHYSDFHQCNGSKGCKGLRFDLQDIKVCLD